MGAFKVQAVCIVWPWMVARIFEYSFELTAKLLHIIITYITPSATMLELVNLFSEYALVPMNEKFHSLFNKHLTKM